MNSMGSPVACDLLAFSKEKRLEHLELSKNVLIRWPEKKEDFEDGYVFHYRGDENKFLALAQWASGEHRCCPWATYAVEVGPNTEGKAAAIKLRWGGRKDGKAFQTDALKVLEESVGSMRD